MSVQTEVGPDLFPRDRVSTVSHLLPGGPGSSDICGILQL